MLKKKEPKYYRYIVLFEGETEEVEPILQVSDINELKKDNLNQTHLFDERLVPTLPAIEYCMHLPRCEMDTYDTPIEFLDLLSDVAHDIIIMSDKLFLMFPVEATLVICTQECNQQEIEKCVESLNIELGVISVKELNNELLIKQWNYLYDNREVETAVKLTDIDIQFCLKEDKQLTLPALYTARQYNGITDVYQKIFNTDNMLETCANIIWNQRVHHNGLMYCRGLEEKSEEEFRKKYKEGMEKAQKSTHINVVITLPGVSAHQIKYGGLESLISDNEKRAVRILGLHRAIAEHALLIELPQVHKELFFKLNELEINCKQRSAPNNVIAK